MITVRLPAMLGGGILTVNGPVGTVQELTLALRRERPDLATRLNDPLLNFAINDEMLIHDAGNHPLRDGDVVEIVPAISGG